MIRKHKDCNFQPIRRPCKVDGCDDPARVGLYCDKHRQRVKKYGDPHAMYLLRKGERSI